MNNFVEIMERENECVSVHMLDVVLEEEGEGSGG